jgi:ATP-dependent RNA helicase DDX23/PRP28
MKASEKFRFVFDWASSEDTSKDLNPLYNNLHREFGVGLCGEVAGCLAGWLR